MRRALTLAARAIGRTSPNPAVGAVVVQGTRIVGEGYHRRAGEPHAEVIALREAATHARGATLYVTLEPCCHREKRTPPCTDAIRSSGVKRLVIAALDPNPRVSGRAIAQMRDSGIETTVGILRDKASRMNEAYARWIRTRLPFVTLKIASTLDGKIATSSGESRWITGAQARDYTHQFRDRADAVLVGLGTVLADDPELTSRGGRGRRTPHRIIVDERLATPPTARALKPRHGSQAIVATTTRAPVGRRRQFEQLGVRVLVVRDCGGQVDLRDLMRRLGAMDITSVLIEGGAAINASALRSGVVQKVVMMLAPKLLGGQDAIGAIGGRSPKHLRQAVKLQDASIRRLGEDMIVEGYV